MPNIPDSIKSAELKKDQVDKLSEADLARATPSLSTIKSNEVGVGMLGVSTKSVVHVVRCPSELNAAQPAVAVSLSQQEVAKLAHAVADINGPAAALPEGESTRKNKESPQNIKLLNEAMKKFNEACAKDEQNEVELKAIIEGLINEKDGLKLIELFLKLLEPDSQKFWLGVLSIYNLFPALKSYLREDLVLRPDGLRLMLNYLKQNGTIPVNCIVCDDTGSFYFDLVELVKSGKQKQFFIVQYANSTHTMPIYVENTKEGWRVFITDSIGGKQDLAAYANYIWRCLNHVLQNSIIYSCVEPRQTTSYGCGIFSILDIIEISKHPDIFRFAADNSVSSEKADDASPHRHLTGLPITMIKPTQSFTWINQFLGQMKEKNMMLPPTKTRKTGELFKDFLDRHTVTVVTDKGPKRQNTFLDRKLQRFVRIVTTLVVREALSPDY